MRAKSRSTMHEVNDLRSIADRWSSRPRAARLMPEGQGILPPPPVEDRRSKQDRLNSRTSRGGVRALSIRHVWERPGERALRCPVLYRRDLATIQTPQRAELMPLAGLHPPAQGKPYAATLSPPGRRWEFFCRNPAFFHPGLLGLFS